ncbi:MAG TPA: PH domain-containing protein [Thermoanaerobaculia bacterium]|nr:PH domain-containing protein [Thermoanaerobaculia bacterium]HQR66600.1 PH domain-containing protein [Thermoanaerobaculia bacterium]
MQRFDAAPWSTALKVVSALGTAVLLGVGTMIYRTVPRGSRVPFAETFGTLLTAVPLLILVLSLLYVVTGYRLDTAGLEVQRLLWTTRVGLEGLERAWHDPEATCRSIRIWGNGGLYSVSGWFRNAGLGRYRAFVTDPRKAVVLRSPTRVVVLSPADPDLFLSSLRMSFPGVVVGAPPCAARP